MNKAINREELLKVLYKGRATYTYVNGFYPDLPGWDPTWEKRFQEMYGYDPEAAKRLLAEAGYPKGFKAKAWLYPFAGAPELIPLWSRSPCSCAKWALSWNWKRPMWWPPSRPGYGSGKPTGTSDRAPSKKAVEPQIALFNAGKGTAHCLRPTKIYKMWEDLLQMSDPAAARCPVAQDR